MRQRMPGFRQLVQLHLAHQDDRDAARHQERLRADIVALDQKLAQSREALAHAEEQLTRLQADKRAADAELQRLEQQRGKYRSQLMEAKTNEVYKTLLHEIETTSQAISATETTVLEVMEATDAAKQAVASAKKELAAAEVVVQAEAGRLHEKVQAAEARREEARAKAALLEPQVPPELLARYRRVSEQRGGKGMACVEATVTVDRERIEGAQCMECNVAVRAQIMVDLVAREDLYDCPGCGRILYRDENLRPEDQPAEAPAGHGASPAANEG